MLLPQPTCRLGKGRSQRVHGTPYPLDTAANTRNWDWHGPGGGPVCPPHSIRPTFFLPRSGGWLRRRERALGRCPQAVGSPACGSRQVWPWLRFGWDGAFWWGSGCPWALDRAGDGSWILWACTDPLCLGPVHLRGPILLPEGPLRRLPWRMVFVFLQGPMGQKWSERGHSESIDSLARTC